LDNKVYDNIDAGATMKIIKSNNKNLQKQNRISYSSCSFSPNIN